MTFRLTRFNYCAFFIVFFTPSRMYDRVMLKHRKHKKRKVEVAKFVDEDSYYVSNMDGGESTSELTL